MKELISDYLGYEMDGYIEEGIDKMGTHFKISYFMRKIEKYT